MATKKELVEYIKTNLKKGYNEDQIRLALKKAGHSKTIIDGAFKQAKNEKASETIMPAAPSKKGKSAPGKPSQTTSQDDPLSPDTEKILAALGYPIWIISLILILIAKPENKFGKFHGYQGLFFGIAWWVVVVVISMFGMIPYLGFIFGIISWLVGVGFFVVSILYAVKAYQGKTFKVPVIYGLVPASSRM